jgi:hypothetical protein
MSEEAPTYRTKRTPKATPMALVGVYLPRTTHRKLKAKANLEGRSVSRTVRMLIEAAVN